MENFSTFFEAIAANNSYVVEEIAQEIMHTKNMHDATTSEELKLLYRDIALLQLNKLKEALIQPLEELIEETKEYA